MALGTFIEITDLYIFYYCHCYYYSSFYFYNTRILNKTRNIKVQQNYSRCKEPAEDWNVFSSCTFGK